MARILRICADFGAFALGSLIYPRVSAQSASSAFYDLAFSDTLLVFSIELLFVKLKKTKIVKLY